MQSKNIEIRRISGNEIAQAIDLSWEVFLQFEAPEYSEEGVRTFRESLDDKERAALLDWFGAFEDGRLVGTISIREPCHLGGFFVKADCHGKGYGLTRVVMMDIIASPLTNFVAPSIEP